MTNSLDAMTGWFATTPMSEYEGAGESIGGDAKPFEQMAFAALEPCGIERCRRLNHLLVIILSDNKLQNNTLVACSNSTLGSERKLPVCRTACQDPATVPLSVEAVPQNG